MVIAMRWLRGIVLLGFVGVAFVLWANSSPSTWSAPGSAAPGVQYTYPVQSFQPYTAPRYSAQPVEPQPTILPCPPGEVPTTAQWHGQTVPACTIPGGVPANPGTGPVIASPVPTPSIDITPIDGGNPEVGPVEVRIY